jgi:hypothetical protein
VAEKLIHNGFCVDPETPFSYTIVSEGAHLDVRGTEVICPKCHFELPDESSECLRCGIIFEKYIPSQSPPSAGESTEFELFPWLKHLLFYVEPDVNVFYFFGRAILYLVLIIYGFKYVFSSVEMAYRVMPFMHLVNLPFHEAGHIFLIPFGRFMMFLGGTLGQLMMPLVCLFALLIGARNNFGASACLWWFGQNFIDIAPYINDARALKLILLGGVTGRETDGHDWENILRTLGWLKYDHAIAKMAYVIGVILIITALVWGGYILYSQYKNVDEFHR